MKIAVIGSGGVGAFHAGALIAAGIEVHIISTPRHVDAIVASGLRIITDEGEVVHRPTSATVDGAGVGVCDAILMTVKLNNLSEALDSCTNLVGPDTLIVTLENGVVAPGIVAERFGAARAVPGISFIVAFIEEVGAIRQLGRPPRLVIASHALESDGSVNPRLAELVEFMAVGGVDAALADDIDHLIWIKYALICTMGGINILANATTGEVMTHEGTRALTLRSFEEVRAVAAAHGVALTDEDIALDVAHLDELASDATTSLQRDLRAGRPNELEFLNGALVERARAHGIDVPINEAALAVARLHAERRHV